MHYYLLMARTDPQLNLRLPAELKDMLDEAAEKNKRSVTAETVDRLTSSFSPTANPANLYFLMSRMEMRAAEAELDGMELKMMVMELVWSLVGAMQLIREEDLTANDKFREQFISWGETINDAKEKVGDDATNGDALKEAFLAKLDEFSAAFEKTRLRYGKTTREDGSHPPPLPLPGAE
jgi:hypothetical protein